MTRDEAHTLLEVMAINITGELATIENPVLAKKLEAIDMAIEALQQTAWIPVGERLPEDFEYVLVTLGNGYDGVTYDWRSDGDWHDWGKSIIAWMPLPEAYKGGDNHG